MSRLGHELRKSISDSDFECKTFQEFFRIVILKFRIRAIRNRTSGVYVIVDALIKAVDAGVNLVALVSDSTSTARIAPFKERCPDRLVNVCIAEPCLVGTAAGMALGGAHHAIDYPSVMPGFGNIIIQAPSDLLEAEQIFTYALDYEGPVYIRMESAKFPLLHQDDYRFEPGKADVLRSGEDITIIAVGSTVHEAVLVAWSREEPPWGIARG